MGHLFIDQLSGRWERSADLLTDLAGATEIIGGFPLRRGRYLDDDELARAATKNLEPYASLVLGLPWAPSFAASDTLARLADRAGDQAAAEDARREARRLYAGLGSKLLLDRVN